MKIFLALISFLLLFKPAWSQNVGIGTAAPLEKLHIIGNLRSSTLAGVGTRLVLSDPNGTLLNASGSNSPAWLITGNAGTAGGTTTTTGTNFVGTTDVQNLVFKTNNIERGRFSSNGEFFVGTYNTVIAGDLMNAVGNATFPWAVNGYTTFNGGGVYGAVQSGSTIFAAVQGEYSGTNASAAGVRGIAINSSSIGVQGQESTLAGWAGLFNGDVGAVLPGGYWTVSDRSLKTNIQPITSVLERLKRIGGYVYDANVEEYSKYLSTNRRTLGVLAQEVEIQFPEAVIEKQIPSLNTRRTDSGTPVESITVKAVNYDALVPVLIEAIKEQQLRIEQMQRQIDKLTKDQ